MLGRETMAKTLRSKISCPNLYPCSVADPERFDEDPDPDPTFQADAEPDVDPDPNFS